MRLRKCCQSSSVRHTIFLMFARFSTHCVKVYQTGIVRKLQTVFKATRKSAFASQFWALV